MSILLTWTASTGATSYQVKRADFTGSASAVWTVIGTTSSLTYDDTTAISGKVYAYQITPLNALLARGDSSNVIWTAAFDARPAGNSLRDYLGPMQKAVFERLSRAGMITPKKGGSVGVWDTPPTNPIYPYVFIGAQSSPGEFSTKTRAGGEVDFSLTIFSTQPTNEEVDSIANQILLSLTGSPIDLTADGLNIVGHEVGAGEIAKLDGFGVARTLRIMFRIEDLTTPQIH